jgi:hypothetical protein
LPSTVIPGEFEEKCDQCIRNNRRIRTDETVSEMIKELKETVQEWFKSQSRIFYSDGFRKRRPLDHMNTATSKAFEYKNTIFLTTV